MAAWILILTMSWGEQIQIPKEFDSRTKCVYNASLIQKNLVSLKKPATVECKQNG